MICPKCGSNKAVDISWAPGKSTVSCLICGHKWIARIGDKGPKRGHKGANESA